MTALLNKLAFHCTPRFLIRGALVLLFLAGLGIRLYDLTDPPLDFHPARQLRSAIMARGIYYQGQPVSDQRDAALKTMGALETYEPPILEILIAGTYRLTGGEKLWLARAFSSLFWLIAAAAMVKLLRRWSFNAGIIISAGFFLLLTFAVQASRSFQPDPFMVMWISLFTLSVDIWMEKRSWKWAILAGLLGGIAVLVKVVAGFFVGGVLLIAVLLSGSLGRILRSRQTWIILLLSVLPAFAYYLLAIGGRSAGFFTSWTLGFIQLLADHEFYSDWLHMIDSLVSLPMFFTALVGTFLLQPPARRLVLGLWLGYVLYGLSSPYQFITHSYYHLPLVLVTAMGLAPVADLALEKLTTSSWLWRTATALVLIFAAGYTIWVGRSILFVEDFRSEARVWADIGKAVPVDGLVIALTQDYGTRLMYYGWTKVSSYWPATSNFSRGQAAGKDKRDLKALFEKMVEGKRYFLVTAFGQLEAQPELKRLLQDYLVTASGDGYILYDLAQSSTP